MVPQLLRIGSCLYRAHRLVRLDVEPGLFRVDNQRTTGDQSSFITGTDQPVDGGYQSDGEGALRPRKYVASLLGGCRLFESAKGIFALSILLINRVFSFI